MNVCGPHFLRKESRTMNVAPKKCRELKPEMFHHDGERVVIGTSEGRVVIGQDHIDTLLVFAAGAASTDYKCRQYMRWLVGRLNEWPINIRELLQQDIGDAIGYETVSQIVANDVDLTVERLKQSGWTVQPKRLSWYATKDHNGMRASIVLHSAGTILPTATSP